MTNQCEQLLRLLAADGLHVEHVRTNAPYRPPAVGRVPGLRAVFRIVPYSLSLWRAAARADVMHVFANSGWAWHLFAAPAIFAARLRGVAIIVNYRGGFAEEFFARAPRWVHAALRSATLRVTPSAFLRRVFARFGLDAEVVPNIVDLSRFTPVPRRAAGDAPRLLVARNLEPIYDIASAVRALAALRSRFPGATLVVAGTGPELQALQSLAAELGVAQAVRFVGRIDNERMPQLYADADVALNPSTVDNMPISVLEAFASAVPVISTDAGGVPDMLAHERSGLLVPVGDAGAMAAAVARVLDDAALAERLRAAGLAEAQRYAWPQVRMLWLDAYRRAAAVAGRTAACTEARS